MYLYKTADHMNKLYCTELKGILIKILIIYNRVNAKYQLP